MSTSIISATNPHKGTTTSSPFAYSLDSVIQATITNPVGGLISPCQVTLQLSADGGATFLPIESKRGGMGDGTPLILLFHLADHGGKAIWTHGRLVFSGNTASSQLGVTVSAVGDGATWGGGGGGTGTVTAFSFVNANGFTGTVANPTTAPALTLTGGPGGGGAWLTPTAVKTASYAAAAGDFVPVDIASASADVTITLPTTPANGSVVGAKLITISGSHNLYVVPGGADVLDTSGGGTAVSRLWLLNNMALVYVYRAGTWYEVANDLALVELDNRYANASRLAVGQVNALLLPTTGLTITQHAGAIIVPSGTSGTIVLDLSLGDWQTPLPCTGAFTLTFSNATVGQQFTVVLTQASSGGPYAVTWPGVTWIGSPYTAPAMPATASARLMATFKCMSAGIYYGWWLGNSAA